jgi:hypothetical protein
VLAGADELLFDGEEQAARASAPAVTARPAAIFLFIQSPCFCSGSTGPDKRPNPLTSMLSLKLPRRSLI